MVLLIALSGCSYLGAVGDFFSDNIGFKKPENPYLEKRVPQGNNYMQKMAEFNRLKKTRRQAMAQDSDYIRRYHENYIPPSSWGQPYLP